MRRHVNLAFDPATARRWYKRKDIEDLLNGISFMFPPGERFFIRTINYYRHRITDPLLQEQVRRFIHQESMHTKEHSRCNVALAAAFPAGPAAQKYARWWLAVAERLLPRAWQLAVTCAIEHLTAVLADTLLRVQEDFMAESADPAIGALWLWHAVEETEHKAVAFDVYQTVIGKGLLAYLQRICVMFTVSFTFSLSAYVAIRQMRKGSNKAKTSTPSGQGKKFSGLLQEVVSRELYFSYYKRSFHPWNHDNSNLVARWRARFADLGGTEAGKCEGLSFPERQQVIAE